MATNLNALPCWLSLYQEQTDKILNKDFGFDNHGLWFIGNYNGSGYPVQTNVEFAPLFPGRNNPYVSQRI